MIQILDKYDCCGCNACVQVCPKLCINRIVDSEGFWYPTVDKQLCIDCGLCEKVCPELVELTESNCVESYASISKNAKNRNLSSSGGIFFELVSYVISKKGIVFGAKFAEDWSVAHSEADNLKDAAEFRGSKYVQSDTGKTFLRVREYLRSGVLVLYSGTPCQVAALKLFLRKEYSNLITVDFICHGVPSPMIWKQYLQSFKEPISNIKYVSFRDKVKGWKRFSLTIMFTDKVHSKTLDKDLYLRGFLKDLYLRPSCYTCSTKSGKSGSDITLADYWGIDNVMSKIDDDKGISAVLTNTNKGLEILKMVNVTLYKTDYKDILKFNPAMEHSAILPTKRALFFDAHKRGDNIISILKKYSKEPFSLTGIIKRTIRILLIKFGLLNIVKKFVRK